MRHPEPWYAALAAELGHPGYVTLAEIRQAEARECREVAAAAKWRKRGGSYHLDLDSNYYVVKRESGRRTWQIEAWSVAIPGQRYVRTQGGIRTATEARGLALAMPCSRCGLANHLPYMNRRMPARPSLADLVTERWRCMDSAPCEAERERLVQPGIAPVPVDVAVLARWYELTNLAGEVSSHQDGIALTLANPVTGESAEVTVQPDGLVPDYPNTLIKNLGT